MTGTHIKAKQSDIFLISGILQIFLEWIFSFSTIFFSDCRNFKMPLEFLFGRKKTPEEMLRQNQRSLNKAMRDLDRERSKMEQQEKKVIADIKKMAKQGQMVIL